VIEALASAPRLAAPGMVFANFTAGIAPLFSAAFASRVAKAAFFCARRDGHSIAYSCFPSSRTGNALRRNHPRTEPPSRSSASPSNNR
jgi:hypothetical protein